MVEYHNEEQGDTLAVHTDADQSVNFTVDDSETAEASQIVLDRDAVAALVGQLQSWLARTQAEKT